MSGKGGGVSTADEIKKLKGLLDDGILTQEEFDNKKKQILESN
jgi:Short C-terminal domain